MKNLSTELQALLASDLTLATCWRFELADGGIITVTNAHTDLIENSELYRARGGFSKTDTVSSVGLAVDNYDIVGFFDSDVFREEDLATRRFDGAYVETFMVNYHSPDDGRIPVSYGVLGSSKYSDGKFIIEFRDISQLLSNAVGNFYGPYCRFRFGSPATDPVTGKPGCGVDTAMTTVTGTITSVTSARKTFVDTSRTEAAEWFTGGELTFTTGDNAGRKAIVKRSLADGTIDFVERMPYDMQVGDQYSVYAGCNHLFKLATDPVAGPYTGDCIVKHNNGARFGGEPEAMTAALQFGGLDR